MWNILFLLLLSSCGSFVCNTELPPRSAGDKSLSSLEPLFLVSTLDGSLLSVEPKTGNVKWKLDEKPVLSVPKELEQTTLKGPTFLPDPHDGSLYAFEPSMETFSKFPFTIQELVKSSPIRTKEGIIYTGRKEDVWYGLDPFTGRKIRTISSSKVSKSKEGTTPQIFIGRSEYQVTMYDTKRQLLHWNITYSDYSSYVNEKFQHSYDHLLLSSSADGFLLSIDKNTGKIQWAKNFGYPVVATYVWKADAGLQRLEMTSVAEPTILHLMQETRHEHSGEFLKNLHLSPKESMLAPSLYIGQYNNGLYALPALAHQGVTLNAHTKVKMLPGPDEEQEVVETSKQTIPVSYDSWRLIGYYSAPPLSKMTLLPTDNQQHKKKPVGSRLAIGYDGKDEACTTSPNSCATSGVDDDDESSLTTSSGGVDDYDLPVDQLPHHKLLTNQNTLEEEGDLIVEEEEWPTSAALDDQNSWKIMLEFPDHIPTWLITLILPVLVYLLLNRRRGGGYYSSEEIAPGVRRVGKIQVRTLEILGQGSEGTCVFAGHFDARPCAVKRVVRSSFIYAEREVALLRVSGHNPHVVRYFCTERDREFHYIALERCDNTLKDYVENRHYQCSTNLSPKNVLNQAMLGLQYLHKLKIVHRDVKPSNILISMPDDEGLVRVVLSDFGLCKKLRSNGISFSHTMGKMAGTQGWIAPEMISDHEDGEQQHTRMTQAVDIFSMGCVFAYVICGKHPFGNYIDRQKKIKEGNHNLNDLKKFPDCEESTDIIKRMLQVQPEKRPRCAQVLAHPFFWSSHKTLQFFEDVSDRVEKESDDSPIMRVLDRRTSVGDEPSVPVADDWTDMLCELVRNDMNAFRTYRSDSVKDMLRLIRNKKHHYRELDDAVKCKLGSIEDGSYLRYFTSRYPRLVTHAYVSMSAFADETELRKYYGDDFVFGERDQLMSIASSETTLRKRWKPSSAVKSNDKNKYQTPGNVKYQPPTRYKKSDDVKDWRKAAPQQHGVAFDCRNTTNTSNNPWSSIYARNEAARSAPPPPPPLLSYARAVKPAPAPAAPVPPQIEVEEENVKQQDDDEEELVSSEQNDCPVTDDQQNKENDADDSCTAAAEEEVIAATDNNGAEFKTVKKHKKNRRPKKKKSNELND